MGAGTVVQQVKYILLDDLDGADAAERVLFALDGVNYEVDLSAENAKKLREGLQPWIDAGRRVRNARPAGKAVKAAGDETAKVRAWGREQGMEVSDRGRIPIEVREAYKAAH
jgi:hypothetical protein